MERNGTTFTFTLGFISPGFADLDDFQARTARVWRWFAVCHYLIHHLLTEFLT
jgi:hypothetical protein